MVKDDLEFLILLFLGGVLGLQARATMASFIFFTMSLITH